MRGLLADVNIQGHATYLQRLLIRLDLWAVLVELKIEFATFGDLGLRSDLDDRSLWEYRQTQEWVLFTENRNHDGPDSLEATLVDSWRPGNLPVLTLANKGAFERETSYAECVAVDIAELLFDIAGEQYRDRPRLFVPLSAPR